MNGLNAIKKIRHFNRFYTQILGLLDRKLLKSDYSLTEARVLFELGQMPTLVAQDLVKQLHLDPAYLSRLLKRFEKQGFIQKNISPDDNRKQILSLTPRGESVLATLQETSNLQLETLLAHITKEQQDRLVQAMEMIENLLNGEPHRAPIFTIRSHSPGDIGYIVYRHAVLYSQSYGFDATFEAYVASGLAQFVAEYDPLREHLWVVETDTQFIGSIAIVRTEEEEAAQLRWFLIEPQARGQGLGKKLLHEAIEFCKRQSYSKVILWTVSTLEAARHLYARFGFQLTTTKTHQIWGQELTEECWELILHDM